MGRLRVACLQLPAFDLARADEGLRHTLAAIDRAAAQRPHLMVLPEVTYPAYFLRSTEEYRAAGALGGEELARLFGGKAAQHSCYLAVGVAVPAGDGRIHNAALLFGPDGSLAGRYDKSFLWHFDRRWFAAGGAYPVFDTPFGRVGLLICADGRLPEVSRCLAVAGARLLVDCTAWVSWGRRPEELSSPQPEYIMPARAFENGVWVAAAGKVGVEDGTIAYCGRSCVIGPEGVVRAQASSDREETLVNEIDLDEAKGPSFERRPALYGPLTTPTAQLPFTAFEREKLRVDAESRRLAAVAVGQPSSPGELLATVERYVRSLRRQSTDLTLFPDLSSIPAVAVIEALLALSKEEGGLLAVTLREEAAGVTHKTAYLLGGGRVLARHRATHLQARERDAGFSAGDEPSPVAETSAGRVGLMVGAEGLAPEVARCLALRGAEVLLWSAFSLEAPLLALARCRADENRVYLVVAAPSVEGALVVSPAGQVAASTLVGQEMACAAQTNRALSHWKDMAPDTHVILGRQPETYGILVRRGAGP